MTEFEVTTKDGYINTLFRIQNHKKHKNRFNPDKPPLLLIHGGNDDIINEFFTTGRECSFGYALADAGFDLWGGNLRGSRFSRKHLTLDVTSQKYWDFTWDHNMDYDLPSFAEKVFEMTQKKMALVGYSKGSGIMLLGLSDPEFRSRVLPIVSAIHIISPGFYFKYSSPEYGIKAEVYAYIGGEVLQSAWDKRVGQNLLREGWDHPYGLPRCLVVPEDLRQESEEY